MNYSSKSLRVLAVFVFPWVFSILNAFDGINTYLLVGFLKIAKEGNPLAVWAIDNWGWDYALLIKMLLSMLSLLLPLAVRKIWEGRSLRDIASILSAEVLITLMYVYILFVQILYWIAYFGR